MSFFRYLRAQHNDSLESFKSVLFNHSANVSCIKNSKATVAFYLGGHTGVVDIPLENSLSTLSLRCFALAKTLDERRYSAEHIVDFGGNFGAAMTFAQRLRGELEGVAFDLQAVA